MIAHYLRGRPVTPFLDLPLEGRARRSPGSLVFPPSTSISSSSYSFSISRRLRVVPPFRRFNTATVRAEGSTRSSIKLATFRLDRNVNRGGILLHCDLIGSLDSFLSFFPRATYRICYFKLRILIIKVLLRVPH